MNKVLRNATDIALNCLFTVAATTVLATCVLLTHIIALRIPFPQATESAKLQYILWVACVISAVSIIFQPGRPHRRVVFLAMVLAIFATLNAIDLTFLKYFAQPAIAILPSLPRPESAVAKVSTYSALLHQYVPLSFFATSFLIALPAFLGFHLVGFSARTPRLSALAATGIALTALHASSQLPSHIAAVDPLSTRILRIEPEIPLKALRAVDRSHSIALLEAARYTPRTIVLVINEGASFFNRSSDDARISLIDRILASDGSPHLWHIYRNAVTNSSCTDVSLPSILTGSGTHEGFDKLHQLPFIFDVARARGYKTAFYTSSVMEWANLSRFFSQAKIDYLLTASQTGLPLINDLGVDDIAVTKRLAALVLAAPPQENLFIATYLYALHTPYQDQGDLEIPPHIKDRRSRALYILETSHRILFDALRASGRLGDALIIVTADHGHPLTAASERIVLPRVENYGEETLRVPLLIRKPAGLPLELAGALKINTSRLVSNLDIAPTVADLLGVKLVEGLKYSGHSLLRKVPDDRLSVATSINEWRSWPRGAIALARNTDRFICDHDRLCQYRSILPAEAAMTPFEKEAKYLMYMNEALKIPVVRQNISRMYHAHLRVTWSPPEGTERLATRSDLFSSLGELLARPPGDAILHAPAGHTPGHIIYGPYWRLPAGRYRSEIALAIGAGGGEGEHLCTIEVYDGERTLGTQQINQDSALRTRTVAVAFAVPDGAPAKPYEARLWCTGKVSVTVSRVAFLRLVPASSHAASLGF